MKRIDINLRYAFRMLLKSPGFTIVAVLALGLGIGADTAIFSVVDAILLRPLPYRNAGELVILRERTPDWPTGMSVAYLTYKDWRAQQKVFSVMAASQGTSFNLTGLGEPERLAGVCVSADLFPLLGVSPVLGRTFTRKEDSPGGAPVVVISQRLWERKFAKDPHVLGHVLDLDGVPSTVIGVMPPGFRYPANSLLTEVYAPIERYGGGLKDRGNHPGIQVAARLNHGENLQSALADMNTIAARLRTAYPDLNRNHSVYMDTMHHNLVRDVESILFVILGAIASFC